MTLYLFFQNSLPQTTYLGMDHVQVFWKHKCFLKHKSIGNQASDWLTR